MDEPCECEPGRSEELYPWSEEVRRLAELGAVCVLLEDAGSDSGCSVAPCWSENLAGLSGEFWGLLGPVEEPHLESATVGSLVLTEAMAGTSLLDPEGD